MDEQVTPAGIVEKAVNEAKGMSRPAYRGQAAADSWELRSGAVDRLVNAFGDDILADERSLKKLVSQYHKDLILRMEIIDGERMPDLQRLSILQHHGGATGLLDFTESPLAALWFACQGQHNEDGRVFILDIGNHYVAVNGRKLSEEDLFSTEQVVYYDPDQSLSPRIVAQQSLFVICNPPNVPDAHLKSVVIPKEMKGLMTEHLKGLGLSEENLFRDVPGLARANARHNPLEISSTLTPEQHRNLGNRAYQASRYEDALAHYEAYARALPNDPRPLSLVGDTLSALQRFPEAIDVYTQAIDMFAQPTSLDPDAIMPREYVTSLMLHTLHYNRGNAQAAAGNHSEAVSDYDSAMEHGEYPMRNVLFNRGNSKYALEEFDRAFDDFEAAWSEREGSDAAHAMGNCKVLRGEFKEALERYSDGVRVGDPEISAAHCRQHVEYVQRLLDALDGSDHEVKREGHAVYVEATGTSAMFPFVGNRGNAGNAASGMVKVPGGAGFEGGIGFAVVLVPRAH
ncbi:MAG: FRG domain-containing protein [Gemmatimonadetes bacterium]|nr:FRG domain-containing protein [Gemmatimonadota bacterium]